MVWLSFNTYLLRILSVQFHFAYLLYSFWCWTFILFYWNIFQIIYLFLFLIHLYFFFIWGILFFVQEIINHLFSLININFHWFTFSRSLFLIIFLLIRLCHDMLLKLRLNNLFNLFHCDDRHHFASSFISYYLYK